MFTTPERQRPVLPAVDTLLRTAPRMVLPPLLDILNESTPQRPKLPSIGTLDTQYFARTRNVEPSRSSIPNTTAPTMASVYSNPSFLSTPASHSVSKDRVYKTPLLVVTKNMSPSRPEPANYLVDSDADTSVNDLMTKSTKRKTSSNSPTRDYAFISHSPATYPSQEPSIDNALLARRKRRRTSPHELAILNLEFLIGSTPNKVRRGEIAAKVNMSEKAVQIWFQNKRQALRRFKATEREVTELPPTPDSSISGMSSESAPTPLHESTPTKPTLSKVRLQPFPEIPIVTQLSPIRSYSTSNLPRRFDRPSGFNKVLPSGRNEKELVLNLTNKKQPEFARQSAVAATQVRTFKLAPKARKPFAQVNTNLPNVKKGSELQCVHGLLSLREGAF